MDVRLMVFLDVESEWLFFVLFVSRVALFLSLSYGGKS